MGGGIETLKKTTKKESLLKNISFSKNKCGKELNKSKISICKDINTLLLTSLEKNGWLEVISIS